MKRPIRTTLWFVTAVLLDLANQATQETEKPAAEKSEMLVARILVLDPDGHPLDGATVTQSGLRTKAEPGSHWVWSKDYHGPEPKVITNAEGIAEVKYPKYVMEKLETGKVTWSVHHPEYVSFREDRSVDDNPAEIKLQRGFRVGLTAVDAKTGDPIKSDLYASISTEHIGGWKLHKNGMLVSPVFADANSVMRVMQIVEGQPVLFSDVLDVKPDGRSRVLLKDVKLSSGTRVEGRLADSVTRPVKNGHVSAVIVHSPDSNARFNHWNWMDRTPIAEDGTFVFDSLPSREVLQLVAVCDDWVPSKPGKDSVLEFFPDQISKLDGGFSLPQLIKLSDETANPILEMEPATSVRVTVLDPSGNPLPNAKVGMCPNQLWFNFGSQILGAGSCSRQNLLPEKDGELRKSEWEQTKSEWDQLFFSKTDEHGIALIKNLPANRNESIAVGHEEYEMPIAGRDRSASVDLKSGVVAEITIQMQKKGTEVLGAEKDEKADNGAEQDDGN